jgi:hypothetical protein
MTLNSALGEVIIVDHVDMVNTTITYDENITIALGGSLNIVNSTILFNCTYPLEFGIRIESGGSLVVSDTDNNRSTTYDNSILKGNEPFFLIAEPGSSIVIINSNVQRCGEESEYPIPLAIKGGLVIRTDDFSLLGVVFNDSYCGVTLESTNDGVVQDCTFRNLTYGIKGDMASDFSIEDCSFRLVNNCVYLRTAVPGAPYKLIGGSIVIKRCTFSDFSQIAVNVDYPRNVTLESNSFTSSKRKGVVFIGVNPDISTPFNSKSTISRNHFDEVQWPIVFEDIQDASIVECHFINFTIAISLNMVTSEQIRIETCVFRRGIYGVDLNVRSAADIYVGGNLFEKMNTGVYPSGEGFLIVDNTFEKMRVAGVVHESDGVLNVTRNVFINSTFGLKVQHEFIPRPGLVLDDNSFINNNVGLLARDVDPISIGSNRWIMNRIGALFLGIDVSISAQDELTDCDVALRFVSSRGMLNNITVTGSDVAIQADLASDVTARDSTFTDCTIDCHAANTSSIRIIDSIHRERFDVLDHGSSIQVLWTVTVHVSYISDDSPASGILVSFEPKDGSSIVTHTTNGSGDIGPYLFLQSEWTPSGGQIHLPYNVTVFYLGLGHSFDIRFEKDHIFNISIDDVDPLIVLHNETRLKWINLSIIDLSMTLKDNDSYVESVEIEVDGDLIHLEYLPPIELHLEMNITDGIHRMKIKTKDAWSNSVELTVSIIVDSSPPQVYLTSPLNGTLTNRTTIVVNGSTVDVHRGQVQDKDLHLAEDGSFSIQIPLEEEGLNNISVQVWDGFNNSGRTYLYIYRDTTAPWVHLDEIPNLTNSHSLRITGSTDGIDVRQLPDGPWVLVNKTFEVTVELSEGTNDIGLEFKDAAGNMAMINISIRLDTTIEFTIESPLNGATVEEGIIDIQGWGEPGLRYRLSDPSSGDWMTLDTGGEFNMTLTLATFGQNNFIFEVKDPAGNTGTYLYNVIRAGKASEPTTETPVLLIVISLILLGVIIVLLYLNMRARGVQQ